MQSDLVIDAETEILSLPTKTTNRNERHSTNNKNKQTRTRGPKSKSSPSSSSSPSPPPTKPLNQEIFLKNGMKLSPVTLWTSSSRVTRHSNREAGTRTSEQSVEHDELGETAINEEKTAETDIPFGKVNGDLASRGKTEETKTSTRIDLGVGTVAGNSQMAAACGNIRNSKVSDFKDSAYSPVSTKSENMWLSNTENRSLQCHISPKGRDEKNCRVTRRAEVTDSENYGSSIGNGGRFSVPPPKYSNPYPIELDHKGSLSSFSFHNDQNRRCAQTRLTSVPQHILEREKVMTLSCTQQGVNTDIENCNNSGTITTNYECPDIIMHEVGENVKKTNLIKKIEQGRDDQKYEICDKNLDHNVKTTDKVRRRSKQQRKQQVIVDSTCTDDEMSTVNYGPTIASHSAGLQERAHQAWKSRQRKNSAMRLKNDYKSRSDKVSNVSFGASDTIHHFEPDVLNRHHYNNEDDEDISLDRSLNSEYTKTLESEVEDMIKDILFIGSPKKSKPGRRKYRYKPEIVRKLRKDRISNAKTNISTQIVESNRQGDLHGTREKKVEDDSTTASTIEKMDKKCKSTNDIKFSFRKNKQLTESKHNARNCGDERRSLASTISRGSSVGSNTIETFQSEKDAIEDPLNTVIGFVEDGLSAMTSVIGYAIGGDHTNTEEQEGTIDDYQTATSDYGIFESCGIHVGDQKAVAGSNSQIVTRATDMLSENIWVDYAKNVGIVGSKNAHFRSKKGEQKSEFHEDQNCEKRTIINEDKFGPRTSKLGNSPELIRLAMYAARSLHKLQGVEYDDSISIEMHKDVKKYHVMLELPLGIIFLENDGGCFVTKVSPDGSAARSRRVEVGDQLASINGTSSSKMKVDDICDAIRRSSDLSQIKLVFVRYIGPFRPFRESLQSEHIFNNIDDTTANNERTLNTSPNKKPMKIKNAFRLFGKGKKNNKN